MGGRDEAKSAGTALFFACFSSTRCTVLCYSALPPLLNAECSSEENSGIWYKGTPPHLQESRNCSLNSLESNTLLAESLMPGRRSCAVFVYFLTFIVHC